MRNSGTNKKGETRVAEGRATTPDESEPGKLRVSFTPQFLDIIFSNLMSITGVNGKPRSPKSCCSMNKVQLHL